MDIHPHECIATQLNQEDPECKFPQKLIPETKTYIKILEDENTQYLNKRQESQLNAAETDKLLRNQERIYNTKLILQYLHTFLAKLPLEKDVEIEGKIVNPFEEIRSFILYQLNLLKEKDVYTAILREHERLGLLKDTNYWYYRGQIDKGHKTLTKLIRRTDSATVQDYHILFLGLQCLCTFWFSVRNEDIKRVRKSDIFIYKLTRYLLEKYK